MQAVVWVLLAPVMMGVFLWTRSRSTLLRASAVSVALLEIPLVAGALGLPADAPVDEPAAIAASNRPSDTEPPSAGETATPSPSPTRRSLVPPIGARLSPSPVASRSPGAASDLVAAVVLDVTDGDTLDVEADGGRVTVRLAQVDAPESHECFGPEATAALRALAPPGTSVALRRPGPPFIDPYDRALAELIRVDDGVSVSVELVAGGYAGFAAKYADEDPDLAGRLAEAERGAQASNAGLWGACGSPHAADAPPPAPQGLVGGPAAGSPWGGSCHAAYDPCVPPPSETGDLDCPDIRAHYPNGVAVNHAHGDPHRLDGDKDGWGCD